MPLPDSWFRVARRLAINNTVRRIAAGHRIVGETSAGLVYTTRVASGTAVR